METFKEFCVFFLIGMILFIGLLAGLINGMKYIIEPRECATIGRTMNLPAKWNYWGGCFIQTKRGWVPSGQVVRAQVEQ